MQSNNSTHALGDFLLFFIVLVLLTTIANVTGIHLGEMIALMLLAIVGIFLLAELIRWKRRRWQFSLRTLLIVTTCVAVVFGLVAVAIR